MTNKPENKEISRATPVPPLKSRFKPGQSGNPGGRPKDHDIRALARSHTKTALETLIEVAKSKKAPAAARVSASAALLDRGYGKPTQPVEGDGKLEIIIRRIVEGAGSTSE